MRSPTVLFEWPRGITRAATAATCVLLILSAGGMVCAQGSDASVATAVQDAKIPPPISWMPSWLPSPCTRTRS